MLNLNVETVLEVNHWNEQLFSFKTTRDNGFRFRNGEFVMLGLCINNKPVLRAYSIASANYEDHLEFLSIKVENGALTSHLKQIQNGDKVLIKKKPTGTLVIDDLKSGRNLYLFATGTGLAPFLSIIHDMETYQKYDKIILCHGVRFISDLAYKNYLELEVKNHIYLGNEIKDKFLYYLCVTREKFKHNGRLTKLIESEQLFMDLELPVIDPSYDSAMICGSQNMISDLSLILDRIGFNKKTKKTGNQGDYVIEKAFVG